MRNGSVDPITGAEEPSRASGPVAALAEFYRAFNTRDIPLMAHNWDNKDEISMDNPLGGICRGWPEIRSVYERIFNGRAVVSVEFYDYTIQTLGSVFCAVGRERGTLSAGADSLELKIRTTRLFRFADGRWRQVHHHGSIEDPDLLARYRAALR